MSQRFSILTILLLSGGLPMTAAGQVDQGSQGLSGKEKKMSAASDASGDVWSNRKWDNAWGDA